MWEFVALAPFFGFLDLCSGIPPDLRRGFALLAETGVDAAGASEPSGAAVSAFSRVLSAVIVSSEVAVILASVVEVISSDSAVPLISAVFD
jgi:hypothetical protein